MRFYAGYDFYSYTANNPTNFADPSGLDYDISQSSDGTIIVTVPITFYGSMATPDRVNRWKQWIAQKWNGHWWNGCHVLFSIPVVADPSHEWSFTAVSSPNMVYVRPGYYYQRNTTFNGWPWLGYWWNDASPRTIAHEFGHFLGLDDHYDPDTYEPKPGWESDIMSMGPNVTKRDLDHILKGHACECNKK